MTYYILLLIETKFDNIFITHLPFGISMVIGAISFFRPLVLLNESQFWHCWVEQFLILQVLHNQESFSAVISVELFDGLMDACKWSSNPFHDLRRCKITDLNWSLTTLGLWSILVGSLWNIKELTFYIIKHNNSLTHHQVLRLLQQFLPQHTEYRWHKGSGNHEWSVFWVGQPFSYTHNFYVHYIEYTSLDPWDLSVNKNYNATGGPKQSIPCQQLEIIRIIRQILTQAIK